MMQIGGATERGATGKKVYLINGRRYTQMTMEDVYDKVGEDKSLP